MIEPFQPEKLANILKWIVWKETVKFECIRLDPLPIRCQTTRLRNRMQSINPKFAVNACLEIAKLAYLFRHIPDLLLLNITKFPLYFF